MKFWQSFEVRLLSEKDKTKKINDHLNDPAHRDYLKSIAKMLTEKFMPKRVLDVGCGRGDLVVEFSKIGVEIYGIDILEESITRSFREEAKDKVCIADAERLPFKQGSFDLVIAHHVIEHLHNPELFIRETHRVLRKGGVVFCVTTIPPFGMTKLYRILRLQREPTHVSLHSRSFWIKIFEENGFKLIGNLDKLLLKDPPLYPLGRLLIKFGPIGKQLWLKTATVIRASFLFKKVNSNK